jgi:hypothetical protein
MEDKLQLTYKNAANKLVIQRWKETGTWCDFYATEATMNRHWTQPNYNLETHCVIFCCVRFPPQDMPDA